jgi:hypothetical protein
MSTSRSRPGWTGRHEATKGTGGWWEHIASSWRVYHCGHPTALWPYYGVPAGHDGGCPQSKMMLAGGIGLGGRAFRLLADCQAAVEVHVNERALREACERQKNPEKTG